MKKNYARDFDDKTLRRLLEEEQYRNRIYRDRLRKLREDFWFYFFATVWMLLIICFPQYTIFVMLVLFYASYRLSYLKENYYHMLGVLFVLLGAYYALWLVVWLLRLFIPTVYVIVIVLPYAAFLISLACTVRAGGRCLLNSKLPCMRNLCHYLGNYNLSDQKTESDERICRLESEQREREKNGVLEDSSDGFGKKD